MRLLATWTQQEFVVKGVAIIEEIAGFDEQTSYSARSPGHPYRVQETPDRCHSLYMGSLTSHQCDDSRSSDSRG
jgi:hypothetical protein